MKITYTARHGLTKCGGQDTACLTVVAPCSTSTWDQIHSCLGALESGANNYFLFFGRLCQLEIVVEYWIPSEHEMAWWLSLQGSAIPSHRWYSCSTKTDSSLPLRYLWSWSFPLYTGWINENCEGNTQNCIKLVSRLICRENIWSCATSSASVYAHVLCCNLPTCIPLLLFLTKTRHAHALQGA